MLSFLPSRAGRSPTRRYRIFGLACSIGSLLAAGCGEPRAPLRFSEAMARTSPAPAGTGSARIPDAPLRFSEGLAPFARDGRWGYVDSAGSTVIPPRYALAGPFREGRAAVLADSLWGYIDRYSTMVVTPRFSWAGAFSEGRAPVDEWTPRGIRRPEAPTRPRPPRRTARGNSYVTHGRAPGAAESRAKTPIPRDLGRA